MKTKGKTVFEEDESTRLSKQYRMKREHRGGERSKKQSTQRPSLTKKKGKKKQNKTEKQKKNAYERKAVVRCVAWVTIGTEKKKSVQSTNQSYRHLLKVQDNCRWKQNDTNKHVLQLIYT